MKQLLDGIAGLEIGVIDALTAEGKPVVRLPDGSTRAPLPLWTGSEIRWSDCVGLRAAVAPVSGSPDIFLLVGLLDRPPAPRSERVRHVTATDELILECGKSKISLRADGRVVILGGYLLSRSSGVNKIKGGSVEIN